MLLHELFVVLPIFLSGYMTASPLYMNLLLLYLQISHPYLNSIYSNKFKPLNGSCSRGEQPIIGSDTLYPNLAHTQWWIIPLNTWFVSIFLRNSCRNPEVSYRDAVCSSTTTKLSARATWKLHVEHVIRSTLKAKARAPPLLSVSRSSHHLPPTKKKGGCV